MLIPRTKTCSDITLFNMYFFVSCSKRVLQLVAKLRLTSVCASTPWCCKMLVSLLRPTSLSSSNETNQLVSIWVLWGPYFTTSPLHFARIHKVSTTRCFSNTIMTLNSCIVHWAFNLFVISSSSKTMQHNPNFISLCPTSIVRQRHWRRYFVNFNDFQAIRIIRSCELPK